jgi:hypothetical protein
MFVQITDQRNLAGHYFEVLHAHDNTLFVLAPDHVYAGITRRQCRMHAVMVNALDHDCISISSTSRRLSAAPLSGREDRLLLRLQEFEMEAREKNPCRGPAAIASLRPETLRPCLSACLPSGGRIASVEGNVKCICRHIFQAQDEHATTYRKRPQAQDPPLALVTADQFNATDNVLLHR